VVTSPRDLKAKYAMFRSAVRPKSQHGINQETESYSSWQNSKLVNEADVIYADLIVYQMCQNERLIPDGAKVLQGYNVLI